MLASDWTVFCPCGTRLTIRLINPKKPVGYRLVIPFALFSLHELDLAYSLCFQTLLLQYFDFKANVFYLQN